MIKVFKGSATESELAAIESALTLRQVERTQESEYGKPILRGTFDLSDGSAK